MPSSKNYQRNYKQEASTESEKRKQARRDRMKARYKKNQERKKQGKPYLGSDQHVDHRDGNTSNNKSSNLRKMSASKNSSYPRTRKAKKKNPRD